MPPDPDVGPKNPTKQRPVEQLSCTPSGPPVVTVASTSIGHPSTLGRGSDVIDFTLVCDILPTTRRYI